jgi:hypothetical protein
MLNSGTEPLLNVVEEGLFFIGKRYFEYGSLRPDPVSPSGAPGLRPSWHHSDRIHMRPFVLALHE